MLRRVTLLGLCVAALLAVPALAASTTGFKLTTAAGKSGSFSITGYEFSSGLNPKVGSAGTVTIDVLIASPSEKSLLKDGALKSAKLHLVATLPTKINKTYTLAGAKITGTTFVTGHFGPAAAVVLSYRKLKV